MNNETRWKVAKVVGAAAVGTAAVFALREGLGAAAEGSVAGGILILLAHEALDAPFSSWVYNQLR